MVRKVGYTICIKDIRYKFNIQLRSSECNRSCDHWLVCERSGVKVEFVFVVELYKSLGIYICVYIADYIMKILGRGNFKCHNLHSLLIKMSHVT